MLHIAVTYIFYLAGVSLHILTSEKHGKFAPSVHRCNDFISSGERRGYRTDIPPQWHTEEGFRGFNPPS